MLLANEYQREAARTISQKENRIAMEDHALKGLVAEVGELHGIYQKAHQGHLLCEEHLKKELGDILWMIAEYCTANDWTLEEIMQMNIEKLRKRYPNGFEAEKSLHRAAGDI
jgi:NTP pyrophosphatase (non-canonical NTP hydrolase)